MSRQNQRRVVLLLRRQLEVDLLASDRPDLLRRLQEALALTDGSRSQSASRSTRLAGPAFPRLPTRPAPARLGSLCLSAAR
jgi:hypothetical protein